jgi:hypothetical protein
MGVVGLNNLTETFSQIDGGQTWFSNSTAFSKFLTPFKLKRRLNCSEVLASEREDGVEIL